MSKCLFLLVLGFLTTTAHAQTQALTITLPGGAPLQLIWIDPGRFEDGGEHFAGPDLAIDHARHSVWRSTDAIEGTLSDTDTSRTIIMSVGRQTSAM